MDSKDLAEILSSQFGPLYIAFALLVSELERRNSIDRASYLETLRGSIEDLPSDGRKTMEHIIALIEAGAPDGAKPPHLRLV